MSTEAWQPMERCKFFFQVFLFFLVLDLLCFVVLFFWVDWFPWDGFSWLFLRRLRVVPNC